MAQDKCILIEGLSMLSYESVALQDIRAFLSVNAIASNAPSSRPMHHSLPSDTCLLVMLKRIVPVKRPSCSLSLR